MNHNILSVKGLENCPGSGFFPSDECLTGTYLAEKNSGQAKETWPILEIDLCAYEPCELFDLPTAGCDNCKYFFNRPRYANERNKSYQRRTKTGYWKSTGRLHKIKGGSTKRYLVFYEKETIRGSKAIPTRWIIHEYDNGGEYVIVKLQIKNDKIKKSKQRSRQNVSTDDFTENDQIVYRNSEVPNVPPDGSTEDNQIVYRNGEVQNISTDDFTEDNQIVYRNTEVQNISTDDFTEDNQIVYRNTEVHSISTDDFTEDNQIVYRNTEVQNISTDDYMKDNQTDSHDSEDLYGFEYQNQKEMMINSYPMAPVYGKNSSRTESGFQYQSPAISSDLEFYNPNEKTADDSASPDIEVQIGKNMNIIMSAFNTSKAICQEGFSYETENEFSTNGSEGEWSSIIATPYSNFLNPAVFNGEGTIYSPDYNVNWSLYNDLAGTNLGQSYWFNDMMNFQLNEGFHRAPVLVEPDFGDIENLLT